MPTRMQVRHAQKNVQGLSHFTRKDYENYGNPDMVPAYIIEWQEDDAARYSEARDLYQMWLRQGDKCQF